MSPTEQLARWLHESFVVYAKKTGKGQCLTWEELKGKDPYRVLAAELLANPPACLVETIREAK